MHVTALVTLADGTIRLWEAPRMNKLSVQERLCKEKWRKWSCDVLPWSTYSQYWPDAARYVARLLNTEGAANPPRQLSLNLHWSKIPTPEDGVSRVSLPEHNQFSTIYVHHFLDSELK